MADVLLQSWIMLGRNYRLSLRNVDGLVTGLALPVLLMLVFVVLFGGAIDTGTSYVTYVMPAVILLAASFGAATTAVSVSADLKGGVVDRLRSMPIVAWSFLAGHVGASLVRNLVATALVVVVAVLLGFRPTAGPLEWLAAIGLLSLFILAISWFSAAIGLFASSPEAASGYTFFAVFLPYISSGFVPVETLPSWLQGIAQHQPLTPMIEAVRALLTGGPAGAAVSLAVAWWVVLGAAGFALAAWRFARMRP
jgi:ABC-2 type transport system permease protein